MSLPGVDPAATADASSEELPVPPDNLRIGPTGELEPTWIDISQDPDVEMEVEVEDEPPGPSSGPAPVASAPAPFLAPVPDAPVAPSKKKGNKVPHTATWLIHSSNEFFKSFEFISKI